MPDAPDDFIPRFRKSPVTDPWEPLYSRRSVAGAVDIGAYLTAGHCNARGMVHGGVIAALADNAMGLTYAASLQNAHGVVTLSLSFGYVANRKMGEWLQVCPRLIRSGKSIRVVDALISAGGVIIARANATFRRLS
jgi:uncharacterized protein (TIGR00369 family)